VENLEMALNGSRSQYYSNKARQVRELANSTRDKEVREEYESIASQYEVLAQQAEEEKISR
jgi:hypothetical protein